MMSMPGLYCAISEPGSLVYKSCKNHTVVDPSHTRCDDGRFIPVQSCVKKNNMIYVLCEQILTESHVISK